jgi:DNA mismatch repair protein MLH1
MRQKTPVNMLVRTDSTNPAGRLHAFLHKKRDSMGLAETENELAATRRAVRQRRNPKESADLTSVQELLAAIDRQCHSGLSEIMKHCMYIGMADEVLALAQCKTRLYVLNVVNLRYLLLKCHFYVGMHQVWWKTIVISGCQISIICLC